jgi:hypothetical protein
MRAFGPPGGQLFDGLSGAGLLVSPEDAASTPVFFGNFASIDIHRRMLSDSARVDAYRSAIEEVVQPGMSVMDAGTGSGVLACLAARSGATRVFAVDASDVVEQAEETVSRSGLNQQVTVLRADFATVQLPEPVDVLVTETFGALALAEGASDDLDACRARNVKPDGVVIPHTLELWLAPVSNPDVEEEVLGPFRAVPGVDLSGLAEAARHRAVTLQISPESLASPGQLLSRVPWPTGGVPVEGSLQFEVAPCTLFGFAGWFRIELSPSVALGTGPDDPPTHWGQVFFPMDPIVVRTAGVFTLDATVTTAVDDRRAIEVATQWALADQSGSTFHRVR